MKQLVKNNRTGKVTIEEVPAPALLDGHVLVKNHFSVVSLGTEISSVRIAEKNLLSKAVSRPDDFQKFLALARKEGYLTAFSKAINRLEIPAPLGYSSAGEIISVSDNIKSLRIGDIVACGGGGYASHAEIISVPANLCVKIPEEMDLSHAAFTTLGAISLQGIRQASCQVGENVVVVGLGLMGQLTIKLLKSSGCFPIGIDIDKNKVKYTRKNEQIPCFNPSDINSHQKIIAATDGIGADSIIITASSSSGEVFENTIDYLRDRGTISVVGNVPIHSSWKKAYEKEINIVLSRSYGPGRYDKNYEEKGIDYPINYVRWTENRNMASFVKLLENKKLKIEDLITNKLKFDSSAPSIYKSNNSDLNLGVVIAYDVSQSRIIKSEINPILQPLNSNKINISLIGAGNFAQSNLLPHLEKYPNINLLRVCSNRGITSKHVKDKFGFDYATTNSDEVFDDKQNDCVFITTRHDSHGKYVIEAIKKDIDIFVEKPLTINKKELEEIKGLLKTYSRRLMVGYNRRFSKSVNAAKKYVSNFSDISINYDIYAGPLPKDHWFYDQDQGGSRILSEPIHFLDTCNYIIGSQPKSFGLSALRTNEENYKGIENFSLSIEYNNGSLANINYICNGTTIFPKETIKINFSGNTLIIDDFMSCKLYSKKCSNLWSSRSQDKGFKTEIDFFLKSIINNTNSPIKVEDIIKTTEFMIDINKQANHNK